MQITKKHSKLVHETKHLCYYEIKNTFFLTQNYLKRNKQNQTVNQQLTKLIYWQTQETSAGLVFGKTNFSA